MAQASYRKRTRATGRSIEQKSQNTTRLRPPHRRWRRSGDSSNPHVPAHHRRPRVEKMEPDQSGAEQTSPRGNDWEVVQLTASTYASAPAPRRPELSEEVEAKYGTKGDDDSAAALLMSGHFSVSQSEVESLFAGKDSKEHQKELDAVSNEADDAKYHETCEHKLKDDLDMIPSFDKGKSLSLADMEFDDSKALQGMTLVEEEPVRLSAPSYSANDDAEKDLSWSATESRSEKKTEESTVHKVNPVAGSTKVVSSDDENKPDGSGLPRDAWWKKQLLSLYKNAKESTKFWPIVAAAAALVGMAYFGRRWQKGKLQLQPVKLQPSSSKEKISHAVGPLNRMKDILVAGNLQSAGIHGHA